MKACKRKGEGDVKMFQISTLKRLDFLRTRISILGMFNLGGFSRISSDEEVGRRLSAFQRDVGKRLTQINLLQPMIR
jgi:hypothetical protein